MKKLSTTKLSYTQCIEIFNILNKLDLNTDTKLKHATIKLLKTIKKIAEEYNEKLSDINIEFCYADEKGIIQKDAQGNFIFKKDDLKNREKAIKSLNKEEVEIETFSVSLNHETKAKLNPFTIDMLTGILLEETNEIEETE